MFSGRENPTMVADGQKAQRLLDEIAGDQTIAACEQTAELQRIIHDLPSTESSPPLFDGLGYRGCVLRAQSKAANDVGEIRVYRGAIVVRGQKRGRPELMGSFVAQSQDPSRILWKLAKVA